jgi:hypothetical protein
MESSPFRRESTMSMPNEKSFLKSFQLETLPAEARADIENQFAVQFAKLSAAPAGGATIWSFRSEKCPGCGWYRAGYVALRGCQIVEKVETSDDM